MAQAVLVIVGLIIGGLAGWYLALSRSRATAVLLASEAERRASAAEGGIAELRSQIEGARRDFTTLRDKLESETKARAAAEARLAEVVKGLDEQKKLLEEAKTRLTDTFKALSSDALKSNNQAFLELAKKALEALLVDAKGDLGKRQEAINSLVTPLSESLKRYEQQVQSLEQSRQKAYGSLEEQLRGLAGTHQQLEKETRNLVTALRTPQVRGRWGEISLHRVVELAGMSEHCDYSEQVSVQTEDGLQRPDMVVHLPGGREIVVDAKVSLDAYLSALSAETDADRQNHLTRHAQQIRTHMKQLAAKSYWGQFASTPEFVVMFIPGESFFHAALDNDRTLIEDGMQEGVVLATPTTLVALLRAVAYGWRHEQLAQNAQIISELGKQLYDRLRILSEHFSDIGRSLDRANDAYNRTVRSLESRVFPTARRFKDLGVPASSEIPLCQPLDSSPRALNASDAVDGVESEPDAP
jgi:DNA recombination protein RmuC